jgi:type I restriction enzyme S subunit
MAGEIAFRDLVRYAVGGGWGADEAFPDAVAVRVIRGTDFQNIASGFFDDVPRHFESRTKAERRYSLITPPAPPPAHGGSRRWL